MTRGRRSRICASLSRRSFSSVMRNSSHWKDMFEFYGNARKGSRSGLGRHDGSKRIFTTEHLDWGPVWWGKKLDSRAADFARPSVVQQVVCFQQSSILFLRSHGD